MTYFDNGKICQKLFRVFCFRTSCSRISIFEASFYLVISYCLFNLLHHSLTTVVICEIPRAIIISKLSTVFKHALCEQSESVFLLPVHVLNCVEPWLHRELGTIHTFRCWKRNDECNRWYFKRSAKSIANVLKTREFNRY